MKKKTKSRIKKRKLHMHPLIAKIEKAIELVKEAEEIVDNVMLEISGQPYAEYKTYGRYGFNQLLGKGNPYDNGLGTIMELIEDIPREDSIKPEI